MSSGKDPWVCGGREDGSDHEEASSSDIEGCCWSDQEEGATIALSSSPPSRGNRRSRCASEAGWSSAGLAEIRSRKGKLWITTGILRQGKLLCHVEEAAFLVQQGALKLVNAENGSSMALVDVYCLLAAGKYGCSWNEYLVYCHLKSLGYVVGRHEVPWTDTVGRSVKKEAVDLGNKAQGEGENLASLILREEDDPSHAVDLHSTAIDEMCSIRSSPNQDSIPEHAHPLEQMTAGDVNLWHEKSLPEIWASQFVLTENDDQGSDYAVHEMHDFPFHCVKNKFSDVEHFGNQSDNSQVCADANISIPNQLNTSKLCCTTCCQSEIETGKLKLMFDVHLPNSRFRKTYPGTPAFSLCIKSDCPPCLDDLEELETLSKGIPVKVVSVDCGRISFFTFDTVVLPHLP